SSVPGASRQAPLRDLHGGVHTLGGLSGLERARQERSAFGTRTLADAQPDLRSAAARVQGAERRVPSRSRAGRADATHLVSRDLPWAAGARGVVEAFPWTDGPLSALRPSAGGHRSRRPRSECYSPAGNGQLHAFGTAGDSGLFWQTENPYPGRVVHHWEG